MEETFPFSAAACVSRHPKDADYLAVELALLREVSQALADLFGLRLPVFWKQQAHATASDQLVTEPYVTPTLRERVETSSDRASISML
jgi:hypothetical protein